MEDSSEVVLKYHKLAHEYSKLKAQTSVLKTAIADGQASAAELQETAKKKDQLIRKLEQEVECLNFRNLQLTKRVSILQNDLEENDSYSKHSKTKHNVNQPSPLPDSYGVLNVELQSRIEENEKLHKQIYAADLEHKKEIEELSSQLQTFQSNLAQQERKSTHKIQELEALINTLQKEKIKMQVTIKNYEKEMKMKKKEDETRQELVAHENLSYELEHAKRVIADKIVFNDTRVKLLNSINVPVMQREKHKLLCCLILSMSDFLSDFFRQLSDLYTFLIQRLCSGTSFSEKNITLNLEQNLRDSIPHIKTIPLSFGKIATAVENESFTWDKSSVQAFVKTFQKFIIYLDKLLPFLVLRVEHKDSWIGSSSKAIDLAPKLINLCKKLVNSFKKLQTYFELLETTGSSQAQFVSQCVVIQKIFSCLELLQVSFDESRKLFGSKIALDHSLPMMNQDEKSTDDCILSTLVSISSTLKKLLNIIAKNIDMLSCDIWYKPRNCIKPTNVSLSPCVWDYKNRGLSYLQHISQSDVPSIPYELALKNHKALCDYSDNQENLKQQIEQYRNKLMQLELDKEKWMLECTLMKAKESRDSNETSDDGVSKEEYDQIHKYVQNTVNQLIQQIQYADSQFIAYRNECDTLNQKLKMCMQKKEGMETELTSSQQTIERLKEEQKTLMHSYEDQLNTMSEHLANLNETLTSQKDEIDSLKHAGSKGLKKGKSR